MCVPIYNISTKRRLQTALSAKHCFHHAKGNVTTIVPLTTAYEINHIWELRKWNQMKNDPRSCERNLCNCVSQGHVFKSSRSPEFFQACYAITLLMSFPVCISSQDHFSVSTTSLKSEINYAFLFLFLSKQALWKLQQLHHYPDKSHKKTDLSLIHISEPTRPY